MHPRLTPLQISFFSIFLVIVLAVSFLLYLPFLTPLAIAAVFAVVLQPVFTRLTALFRGQRGLAAFATILLVALVFLVPLAIIATKSIQDATDFYARLTAKRLALPREFIDTVHWTIKRVAPTAKIDFNALAGQGVQWIAGNMGSVFSSTVQTIFHLAIGFIALFYFLKDGPKFLRALISFSPLPTHYNASVVRRLDQAINSIIRGSLFVSLLQGILSGVGMTFTGVPNAALWGTLAVFAAFIPTVGTALINIPAIAFLFLTGHRTAGIVLLVWWLVAVGLIDNLLSPFLVGRGARIHPLFILFAILGGIELFGPLGFILGPLTISLLYALLDLSRVMRNESA